MKINKYIKFCFFILFIGSLMASCGKMDENYGQYLKGGEIVYSGKPDSLKAFSGNKRIKLTWQLASDPKIVKVKIRWNNRADSIEIPVHKTPGIDLMEVIIPGLKEGVHTFEVFTYDDAGNSSIRTEVIGEAFGEGYQKDINNRTLNKGIFNFTTKEATLYWFGAGEQAVVVDIDYTNTAGEQETIHVYKVHPDPRKPAFFLDYTSLPMYKDSNSTFRYRTGFLPKPTAIDVFYTEYSKDIAVLYNLAIGKTTLSSTSSNSDNAIDGDMATFWQPSSGDRADLNTWITVDLGVSKPINQVILAYVKDQAKIKSFSILYSDDNVNWKVAQTKASAPAAVETINFPRVNARYVKLDQTISAAADNITLGEFEIWNQK